MGTTGHRTMFSIDAIGVDIAVFSAYPSESEVLLLPGTSLVVEPGVMVKKPNYWRFEVSVWKSVQQQTQQHQQHFQNQQHPLPSGSKAVTLPGTGLAVQHNEKKVLPGTGLVVRPGAMLKHHYWTFEASASQSVQHQFHQQQQHKFYFDHDEAKSKNGEEGRQQNIDYDEVKSENGQQQQHNFDFYSDETKNENAEEGQRQHFYCDYDETKSENTEEGKSASMIGNRTTTYSDGDMPRFQNIDLPHPGWEAFVS